MLEICSWLAENCILQLKLLLTSPVFNPPRRCCYVLGSHVYPGSRQLELVSYGLTPVNAWIVCSEQQRIETQHVMRGAAAAAASFRASFQYELMA